MPKSDNQFILLSHTDRHRRIPAKVIRSVHNYEERSQLQRTLQAG